MTAARILVLGGYGGFGGRIAKRLVSMGHEVLVAGRNLDKAKRFCADSARLQPYRIDRDDDLETVLLHLRPGALVDASGPFQGASYTVARACIAARIHYVDIADARNFVVRIGALDADARAAGVTVLSGASSVPALSGAVVRSIVNGMESISAVEMRVPAHGGHDSGLMADSVPASWRTAFRSDGDTFRVDPERCPP